LVKALTGAPARGKTALYDAIEAGLRHVQKTSLNKRVLIVVSDGGDNASTHTLDQVLHDAALSDAVIYTIGIFDDYDADSNPGVLKKIARATGGEAFFPRELNEVVSICEQIAADIRSQYTIGYTPADRKLDGGYRAIKVAATRGREKLLVRTRAGYLAPKGENQ
jgi:Ca-activated chloride channel family protein